MKRRFLPGSRAFALLIAALIVPLAGCKQLSFGEPKPLPEVSAGSQALRSHDEVRAAAQFDAAIKKDPHNPDVYLQVIRACLLASQIDLLKQYFQRGSEAIKAAKPEDRAKYLSVCSGVFSMIGQPDEALKAAEEANRLQPDNWQTCNTLGYLYAEAGKNPERAVELTARAVRLARAENISDEDLGRYAVDSLGWAYYKNGQLSEAVRTLVRANNLAPDVSELHLHLALAYRSKKQYEDSKIELLRARACLPKESEIGPLRNKLKSAIDQTLDEVQRLLDIRKSEQESDAVSKEQQKDAKGPTQPVQSQTPTNDH